MKCEGRSGSKLDMVGSLSTSPERFGGAMWVGGSCGVRQTDLGTIMRLEVPSMRTTTVVHISSFFTWRSYN